MAINQGPSPSMGFTFNWYAYAASNITGLTGNGCLYFSTWYLCPYEYASYKSGLIFYRNASSSDLSQISKSITQTYSTSFTATNAFIVTYYNAADAYGKTNTFQAVLVTDGTHSYVIYNFGSCQTRNARSFVQNGTNTFILWDGTASYYLSYSAYMYDYLSYDQNTPAQQTNACNNGQFVYSYPKQTVSCAAKPTSWYVVLIIVLLVLLFLCCCLAFCILFAICLFKRKNVNQQQMQPPQMQLMGNQQPVGPDQNGMTQVNV
jgi:hypothetical protein